MNYEDLGMHIDLLMIINRSSIIAMGSLGHTDLQTPRQGVV